MLDSPTVAAPSVDQYASQAGSDDSDVVITHVVSHPESKLAEPPPLARSRKGKKKIGENDEENEDEEGR